MREEGEGRVFPNVVAGRWEEKRPCERCEPVEDEHSHALKGVENDGSRMHLQQPKTKNLPGARRLGGGEGRRGREGVRWHLCTNQRVQSSREQNFHLARWIAATVRPATFSPQTPQHHPRAQPFLIFSLSGKFRFQSWDLPLKILVILIFLVS